MSPRDRDAWAEGMEEVKHWDPEQPSEYLYWVGCAGAYDDRATKVTKVCISFDAQGGRGLCHSG